MRISRIRLISQTNEKSIEQGIRKRSRDFLSVNVASIVSSAVPEMKQIDGHIADVAAITGYLRHAVSSLPRSQCLIVPIKARSDRFFDSIEQGESGVQISRANNTEIDQPTDIIEG